MESAPAKSSTPATSPITDSPFQRRVRERVTGALKASVGIISLMNLSKREMDVQIDTADSENSLNEAAPDYSSTMKA
jgi:hypothetical protein